MTGPAMQLRAIEKTGEQISNGIDQIFLYNNIAITVLVVCLLLAMAGNFLQYLVGNRRQDKDFDRYLSVVQALGGVKEMLTVIKDKIGD